MAGTTITAPAAETLNFRVDASHVSKYCDAVGQSKKFVAGFLPLGYLSCYLNSLPMNMLTSSEFPLNVVGSVHESCTIKSIKSIPLAAELSAVSTMNEDVELSDKGDWIFTVVTDVSLATDVPEIGSRVLSIENEFRILNPDRRKVKSTKAKPEAVDYATGPWASAATWKFGADTGRKYALLNGDINPIHMYPISAKLFGYKSCIAHGMFSVTRLLAVMEDKIGHEGGTISARFTRPTLLPNQVEVFVKEAGGEEGCEYAIGYRAKDGVVKETVKGFVAY
jgi:acyl dehydratase